MTWLSRLVAGGLVAGAIALGIVGSTDAARAAGAIPLHRYDPPTVAEEPRLTAGFGSVGYALDEEGMLWLSISLRGAAPEAPHEVSLVCGPTVAESCGYRTIGMLLTDAAGDGDIFELAVPLTDLAAAPFGAGARLDHLTIVDPLGGPAYVSDPLRYDLP